MNQMSVKLVCLVIYGVVTIFSGSAAWGAELSVPAIKAKAGESVDIPVMVDRVDNLAGVKLVMKYDTEILTFRKASKTKHTSSLMHIVNDKKPGSLVVVMAGARGIRGENFPILSLKFELKKGLKDDRSTKLRVVKIQMMSDQLKDIQCHVKINPLTVSADRSATGTSGRSASRTEQVAPKSGQIAAPKTAEQADKTAEETAPKTAEQAAPKTAEQTAAKTAEQAVAKTAEQTAAKTAEQAAAKTAEQAAAKTAEQAAPKIAEQTAPKPAEQTAPKSGQIAAEQAAPKPAEQTAAPKTESVKKKNETISRCPLTIPRCGIIEKSKKCGQDTKQDANK